MSLIKRNESVFSNKRQQQFPVALLVAKAFLSNPNKLSEVLHIDGDKSNNAVSNLKWVTRKENIVANIKNVAKGENHGKFKGYYEFINSETGFAHIFITAKEASHSIGHPARSIMRWAKAGKNGWRFIPKLNNKELELEITNLNTGMDQQLKTGFPTRVVFSQTEAGKFPENIWEHKNHLKYILGVDPIPGGGKGIFSQMVAAENRPIKTQMDLHVAMHDVTFAGVTRFETKEEYDMACNKITEWNNSPKHGLEILGMPGGITNLKRSCYEWESRVLKNYGYQPPSPEAPQ